MGAYEMPCSRNLLVMVAALLTCQGGLGQTSTPGVGRPATAEEVRAWDISIGPEGKELPPGTGTAKKGAKIFEERCAKCHGPTATEGKFVHGPLVGGRDTLTTLK